MMILFQFLILLMRIGNKMEKQHNKVGLVLLIILADGQFNNGVLMLYILWNKFAKKLKKGKP
jgi:hypothetical protein